MLIQADLKQIEVVLAAHLSQDQMLIQLLKEGKDVHRWAASNVLEIPEDEVSDLERKSAKQINFGIIYGNGAATASSNTGRDLEWCKNYIKTFYQLFPGLKAWQDRNIKIVEATGRLRMFTGHILKFRKYPCTQDWQIKRGLKETYSPTEIKNYPVQHTAFVITALLLGHFWRHYALHKRDKYLMINSIHDSLMLDCKPEYVDEAKADLEECIDKVPQLCYNYWNEKIDVPIRIDIAVAENWGDL